VGEEGNWAAREVEWRLGQLGRGEVKGGERYRGQNSGGYVGGVMARGRRRRVACARVREHAAVDSARSRGRAGLRTRVLGLLGGTRLAGRRRRRAGQEGAAAWRERRRSGGDSAGRGDPAGFGRWRMGRAARGSGQARGFASGERGRGRANATRGARGLREEGEEQCTSGNSVISVNSGS
jgi:hypothetical protein